MHPKSLLTVTAIVMIGFGTGFMVVPAVVFSMYGVQLEAGGVMLARVAGSAIFALGALAWLSRNRLGFDTLRLVATTLFTFFVLKTLVTLLAQLAGVFNAMGWSIVAIDALFVAAYTYMLFGNPRFQLQSGSRASSELGASNE